MMRFICGVYSDCGQHLSSKLGLSRCGRSCLGWRGCCSKRGERTANPRLNESACFSNARATSSAFHSGFRPLSRMSTTPEWCRRWRKSARRNPGGKGDRGPNTYDGQPRMLGQNLLDGFSSRKFFQDQFDCNPGPGNGGLPHHDFGVGTDEGFGHSKPRFVLSLQRHYRPRVCSGG